MSSVVGENGGTTTTLWKGKGARKGGPPPPVVSAKPTRPSHTSASATVKVTDRASDLEGVRSKLKPTETRVRSRDGTVLLEKRSGACGTVEYTVFGIDTTTPQYVRDQEAGLSRLDAKEFDAEASRWLPRRQKQSDGGAGDANTFLLAEGKLRVVTYNVWFSEHRQRERSHDLFVILDEENADIICLQEVTPIFLSWLRDLPWVRSRYMLSDAVGTTLRGSKLIYGVVMLLSRRLSLSSLCLHVLPTRMNRAALIVSVPLKGRELRVATVHLESLDNEVIRIRQLKHIFHLLVSESCPENPPAVGKAPVPHERYGAAVLAGDMNFDSGLPEERVVQVAGFIDCWRAVALEDDGEGGCTMPVDDCTGHPTRIDRMFSGPPALGAVDANSKAARWLLVPRAMQRLGMGSWPVCDPAADAVAGVEESAPPAPIHEGDSDPEMPDLVPAKSVHITKIKPACAAEDRPSDHFGLRCDFWIVPA